MTTPRKISREEIDQFVEECEHQDEKEGLFQFLKLHLSDPLEPETEKRWWKPHPLLISLGAIALTMIGVFVYFNFF